MYDGKKTNGKPLETVGRKAIGTKTGKARYVSLAADYKGKLPETAGRKAMGLRHKAKPAGY